MTHSNHEHPLQNQYHNSHSNQRASTLTTKDFTIQPQNHSFQHRQENWFSLSPPTPKLLKYFVMTILQTITKDFYFNMTLSCFLWRGVGGMTVLGIEGTQVSPSQTHLQLKYSKILCSANITQSPQDNVVNTESDGLHLLLNFLQHTHWILLSFVVHILSTAFVMSSSVYCI